MFRFFIMIFTVLGLLSQAAASDMVLPLKDSIEGSSAEELAIEWHQWIMTNRGGGDSSAAQDNTGCIQASASGAVWLLVGSGQGSKPTSCRLPAGKNLFLSVDAILVVGDNLPGIPMCKILQKQANLSDKTVKSMVVEIDGVKVDNLADYWMKILKCFNPYSNTKDKKVASRSAYAVSDGYWLLLKPLSPGKHTIKIHGGRTGEDAGNSEVLNKEYEIIAE